MSQVWQIRQSEQGAIAIVSDGNFSCEIAVAEFSYSATELSFRFYPRRQDGFLTRRENVFLGRLLLEGISSYQVESPADSLVVARLAIRGQIQQSRITVESGDIGQRDRQVHTLDFWVGENCRESTFGTAIENIPVSSFVEIDDNGIARRAEQIPPVQDQYPAICQNCRNFHGKRYGANLLICAMHPYGKADCEDFGAKDL